VIGLLDTRPIHDSAGASSRGPPGSCGKAIASAPSSHSQAPSGAAWEHQRRAGADEQRAQRHLRPALPEAPPPLPRLQGQRLPDAGGEQEQADDARALHGPQRVAVEVVARLEQAEMVEVECEVESRHPHDGDGAQQVQALEARRARQLQSVFSYTSVKRWPSQA
jgi:hypothetical protein